MTNETRYIRIDAASMVLDLSKEQRYAVCRDVWFDEDFDGSWLVGVNRSEAEVRGDRPGGSIRVHDPSVMAFLKQLYTVLANPDGYGHLELQPWEIAPESTEAA